MRQQAPRSSQNWIFDNFLKLTPNEDVLHPGIMGIRLERGFSYGDMERVFEKIKGRRNFPRAWQEAAARQEELAEAALASSFNVTAARHSHRAALYYGRAQHLIPSKSNGRKRDYYAGVRRNYDRMISLLDGRLSKHDLDFEDGKKVHCVFHAAPGDGPKPTILYIPGMDAMKEDYPNPFLNDFILRGMNICSMDGPGQGECNINHTWLTLGNYARAGTRVIDYLCSRPDVDPERIGIFGTSMGTRWGPEVAAADSRVKAVAGQMPTVGPLDVIFEQAQPNFKRIHMYMCDIVDPAEMDRVADAMQENFEAVTRRVRCPNLLVGGDLDELCPPEDIEVFMDNLGGPKELWLYKDVFHPMGEIVTDIYPAIADWLLRVLNHGLPADHDRRVYPNPH